jgi:preprotein translocase subunit SecD
MKGTGRLVLSLVIVAALVVGAVAGFLTAIRPVLGLDLVGGIQVVLSAPSGTDKDVMERALDRIRERVDALGVAEPDISLLGGNNIQVQLPGLGGKGKVTQKGSQWCVTSPSGKSLGCFAKKADADAKATAQSVQRVLQIIGTTAQLEERPVVQIIGPMDAAYAATPLTDRDPATGGFGMTDSATGKFVLFPPTQNVTAYQDDNGNGVFDPGVDRKLSLGPRVISGAELTKATAVFVSTSQITNGGTAGWQVQFSLNKDGSKAFASATTAMVSKPTPTNQLAVVLDGAVVTAPVVQGAITGGTGVITGQFSEPEAKNLAVVLNSGSLPVQLTRQTVVTVSPTLGKQSLRQGVLAGLVGLIALMLYLAFYYRLLGLVTWLGMAIWGSLTIGLVSLLGHTAGYALTLAGIAGIIVSLGITADSYIVFYERLKDEVRHGKTLRSAVVPAFKRSWRTIVAADIVTIIAAAALYLLAVGSVRGFALTLGLSTGLDMFVVYFFKRPTVFLIARSPLLTTLRGMGLRSGVAADPLPAVAGAER